MNEIFEYRKKLNIKKIALAIILILFVVVMITDLISGIVNKKEENDLEAQNPNSIFYDVNNTISIELSKQYELSQYKPSGDYLIELRAPNDLNIFISHKNLIENRTLASIVSSDLRSYIEEYNSYSNLSDITEFVAKDKTAYTYSFHYLDSKTNTPFYLQVVWIESENGYYIFDIEFPLENLNNYTKILNEVLESFTIIQFNK